MIRTIIGKAQQARAIRQQRRQQQQALEAAAIDMAAAVADLSAVAASDQWASVWQDLDDAQAAIESIDATCTGCRDLTCVDCIGSFDAADAFDQAYADQQARQQAIAESAACATYDRNRAAGVDPMAAAAAAQSAAAAAVGDNWQVRVQPRQDASIYADPAVWQAYDAVAKVMQVNAYDRAHWQQAYSDATGVSDPAVLADMPLLHMQLAVQNGGSERQARQRGSESRW